MFGFDLLQGICKLQLGTRVLKSFLRLRQRLLLVSDCYSACIKIRHFTSFEFKLINSYAVLDSSVTLEVRIVDSGGLQTKITS